MPNIQLNRKEFEDFDAIMKFMLEVTVGEDIKNYSKDAYREAYGKILGGLDGGSVYNQILNPKIKYPAISKKSYGFFVQAFGAIDNKLLRDGKPTKYAIYNKKFKTFKEAIDKRIDKGEYIYEAAPALYKKTSAKKEVFEDNYLEHFEGKTWYCFERDDNEKISRKVLVFDKKDVNGTCTVTHTVSEKGMEKWKGKAQFISGESLLVITMVNSGSKLDYTHFLIKVDNRSNALELCIGHKTFRNNENDNIVTKTVVLTCIKNDAPVPVAKRFKLYDPEVPPAISTYLSERQRNRLSSPHSIAVFNMETFDEWINMNKPTCAMGVEALVGTYDIYYRISPTDTNWKIDSLQLYLTEGGGLEAKYGHEFFKGEHKEWIGNAHPNYETKIMTLYLKDPALGNSSKLGVVEETDNPIFLMVNLPSRTLRKLDTLTGVATASRDGDRGAVGRLMVLIKREEDTEVRAISLDKLGAFFDYFADRSWVRPPITSTVPSIYKFEHLEQAISEAVERKNGLKSAG